MEYVRKIWEEGKKSWEDEEWDNNDDTSSVSRTCRPHPYNVRALTDAKDGCPSMGKTIPRAA